MANSGAPAAGQLAHLHSVFVSFLVLSPIRS